MTCNWVACQGDLHLLGALAKSWAVMTSMAGDLDVIYGFVTPQPETVHAASLQLQPGATGPREHALQICLKCS